MKYICVMHAAAIQQWKQINVGGGNLAWPLTQISFIVVFTWIAMQEADPAVLTYLLVGLPLMTIWSGVAFRVGYTLNNELSNQTLQFVYASPTPVIVVSIGKAIAQFIWGLPTGVLSFGIVFLITRTAPQVADVGSLVPSLLFVVAGMVVTSLFFSPLMVLVGGRAGFFNAIIPFGFILSGFMFPVDRLPPVLEVMARCMPTSWAMENVWLSIQGTGSWQSMAGNWGMCILTSVVLSGVTYLMFKIMERRIRVTGTRDLY
jgi:ABC-type polysaccharide/polyol phosphate export permease